MVDFTRRDVVVAGAASAMFAPIAAKAAADVGNLTPIKLLPPELGRGAPLMDAIKERHTVRELKPDPLSLRDLSDILWVADGINRDNGKRTAPTAYHFAKVYQCGPVFVFLPEGLYRHDPETHTLIPVKAGDQRKLAGGQPHVLTAPLNLMWTLDLELEKKMPVGTPAEHIEWACVETGHKSMAVYLYCAAMGTLGAGFRAGVPREEFLAQIAQGLGMNLHIVGAETIGYLA